MTVISDVNIWGRKGILWFIVSEAFSLQRKEGMAEQLNSWPWNSVRLQLRPFTGDQASTKGQATTCRGQPLVTNSTCQVLQPPKIVLAAGTKKKNMSLRLGICYLS